jgi:hypothetical protein
VIQVRYPLIRIALTTEEAASMANTTTGSKFPDGSTIRDYDIFEELPDGTPIWRTCVVGMKNAESKLWEMARETNNKVYALNLQDRTQLWPFRSSRQPEARSQMGTARRMD